jgi:uncharacterized repeat protein (TIGR03803 family)
MIVSDLVNCVRHLVRRSLCKPSTRMRRNLLSNGALLLIVSILVFATLAPGGGADAAALKTLHRFCPQGRANCTDGATPFAGLIMDGSRNLYGTTANGGANLLGGTVFELTPDAATRTWTETVLYSFCSQGGSKCTDGKSPFAGLIMDAAGNLYGTTFLGGAHRRGTVFALTRDAATGAWTETVLHSFCSQSGCTDGAAPFAGLIMDGSGNLYGTTASGGAHSGGGDLPGGTAFELTPDAATGTWKETVLHSFCPQISCTDGFSPQAGLIMDAAGNLYGTTYEGGAHSGGTAFALIRDAATGAWTETVLHSFCSQGGEACTDGASPAAALTMDAAGHLYGTTYGGGVRPRRAGRGTVFELTPGIAKAEWREKVLYAFCSQGGAVCTDGASPTDGLIMDTSGHLYGTTRGGGPNNGGTVFELRPDAAETEREKVLYSFCSKLRGEYCTDGADPEAGLIIDASGNLYGMTTDGGTGRGWGTVFEVRR